MPCVDDSFAPTLAGRASLLNSPDKIHSQSNISRILCVIDSSSSASSNSVSLSKLSLQAALLILMFLVLPLHVIAQQNEADQESEKPQANSPAVIVQVRTIKGSKPKEHGESQSNREIEIDSRLDDIRGKLGQINFQKYRLLAEDELSVRIKRKHSMVLKDHTVLTVRPLYIDDEKVGMWLKWTDASGEQVLLDTRMHFVAGDSMIAGTDSAGDCGIILSIKAQQSNRDAASQEAAK